ncbi:hypothetical protein K438DRAFT_1869174 [Mycena galopus ATCC 62051]|nr:hypothetical protein K438DRAFT_1869174 [Mycena galopus ATCC 62051]
MTFLAFPPILLSPSFVNCSLRRCQYGACGSQRIDGVQHTPASGEQVYRSASGQYQARERISAAKTYIEQGKDAGLFERD